MNDDILKNMLQFSFEIHGSSSSWKKTSNSSSNPTEVYVEDVSERNILDIHNFVSTIC